MRSAKIQSDTGPQLEEFGSLFASSIEHDSEASLDWALIKITQPRLDLDTIMLINGSTKFVILHDKPLQTKVFAKTASNGIRHGDLSPMPIFMLLPGSPKFQEVWTVHFYEYLGESACFRLAYKSDKSQRRGIVGLWSLILEETFTAILSREILRIKSAILYQLLGHLKV
jgi:hypothetical protein